MSDWLRAQELLIIGHRGASADAPENTLSAFALAAEQGADGFEFDVQLSVDGRPVVMHDSTVDRTCDGTGKVCDLTVAELQGLDAGDGQGVPTLDQLFEMFGPTMLYNVELKGMGWRDTGLEAAVAERIEGHQLEERVLVSSFNPLAVRRARRYLSGRTPVAMIRYRGPFRYTHLLARGQADHPHYSLVDEGYMEWARRKGYRVHVWTVDEPDEAQRLARLGVHGIVSNKPRFIRDSLQ